MPKVSIILPTYNRASLLVGVVNNLLSQTFRDLEIILVDDGSTDDTEKRMTEIPDPRLRYFRKSRLGVPRILNEGTAYATGSYCLICHDHDDYDHTMVEAFVAFLDAHPSVSYVFSGLVICDLDGVTEVRRDIHDFPPVISGKEFLTKVLMPRLDSCVGVFSMFRREHISSCFLKEEVGGCADVELWHRLCLHGDVGYIKTPLIRVRGRDPTSQFFLAQAELTQNILAAKSGFIQEILDPAQRSLIRKNWQRDVDRTVLSTFFKCLAARDESHVAEISALAKNHASFRARLAFSILSSTPHVVACSVLHIMRLLAKFKPMPAAFSFSRPST